MAEQAEITQKVERVEGGVVIGAERGGDSNRANRNDVHIALNRIADVSERELTQIQELARQVDRLAGVVTKMQAALAGDAEYGQIGLIERMALMSAGDKKRERMHAINTAVLITIAFGQLMHTAAIIYLYRLVWWAGG